MEFTRLVFLLQVRLHLRECRFEDAIQQILRGIALGRLVTEGHTADLPVFKCFFQCRLRFRQHANRILKLVAALFDATQLAA